MIFDRFRQGRFNDQQTDGYPGWACLSAAKSSIFQWSPVGRERTRAGRAFIFSLPLQNNEGA